MAAEIAPDGRVRSLVKDLPLNWVPDGWLSGDDARRLIAARLALVAEWARYRHLQAKSADAELLDFVATGLETQLRARRQGATSYGNRERGVRTQRSGRTHGGRCSSSAPTTIASSLPQLSAARDANSGAFGTSAPRSR